MSEPAIIDFATYQFPAPLSLEQLLEKRIGSSWKGGSILPPHSAFVKSEWICCGPAAAWPPVRRTFDDNGYSCVRRLTCHGARMLTYRWYLWVRYETGAFQRVYGCTAWICPTCSRVLRHD